MAVLTITDDGDETLNITVDGNLLAEVGHGEFGWYGMEKIIDLIQSMGDSLGFQVDNEQEIV